MKRFLCLIFFFAFIIVFFPNATKAATEFVTTVNTDGGGDYSSLSAWEAAINCDLTAATTKVFSHGGITGTIIDGATVTGATSGATSTVRHVTATQILMSGINGTFQSGEQVYQTQNVNYVVLSNAGDSAIARVNCSGATADTASTTITNWTTSATNYIEIIGDYAVTSGVYYSTNYYRIELTNATGITVQEDFVRISKVQIQVTYSTGAFHCITAPDGSIGAGAVHHYFNNVLHLIGNGNYSGFGMTLGDASATYNVYNNIVYFTGSSVDYATGISGGGTRNIYNNTVYGAFKRGINVGVGTNTARNNLVEGTVTTDYSGTFTTTATNISEDNTSPDVAFRAKTATFVNEGAYDFHLDSTDTNCINTGTDVYSDATLAVTTDVDGDILSVRNDIGADEIPNTAPNAPSSLGSSAFTGGEWTASTTPQLTFTQSDSDSADTVQFRIQVSTSSSYATQAIDYTSALMATGTASFTVGQAAGSGSYTTGQESQTLSDNSYYWRVMSTDNSSATSTWTTASSGIAFKVDTTAPSGGSLDFTDGYYTATSVIISYATGTDSGAGMDTSTGKIQRRETALSSGSCGSYGSWADLVTEYDGSYADTSVVTSYCYQYQYLIADNVANWATSSSTNVAKIDTGAPSCSLVSLTASSSQITIVATSSDAISGLHSSPFWFIATSTGSGISSSTDWQASASFIDTGLSPNTQYTYQVKARNTAGNESSYSTASSTHTLANVPAALSATADSATQLTASWTANSNPAGTYYYLENTTNATNSGWITAVSWASTGLSCNTSYSFRVKARNGDSVETSWSDTATQTTSACPTTGGGGGGNFLIYSQPPVAPAVVPLKETPRPIYGIPELIQKIPEVIKKIPEVFAPETPSLPPIPGIESTALVFPSLKIGLEPLTRKIQFSLDWDSLREYLATDKDQPLFVAESKIPLFSQMITEKLRQIRVAMRTKLQVLIRPKKPIKTLTAELLLKKITKKDQAFAQIDPSLISAELRQALAADKPGYKIADYQFADPDQDGVWTADLVVPAIDGIYTFRTILAFQDGETKIEETEIMVEPEGYVYERIKNQELRIKDARISLYWFNPLTKQYQLWPGEEFDQKNPQVTNQRGTYKFTAPEGKYYLTAVAEGYQPCQSEEFEIAQGGGIIRNIEMRTTRKSFLISSSVLVILPIAGAIISAFVFYILSKRRYLKSS